MYNEYIWPNYVYIYHATLCILDNAKLVKSCNLSLMVYNKDTQSESHNFDCMGLIKKGM